MPKTEKTILFSLPAEWEKHSGTWLSYPHNVDVFGKHLTGAQQAFVALVKALAPQETVYINVGNLSLKESFQKKLGAIPNVQIHCIPTNDTWCRDHGAIFVKGKNGQLVATDWLFNAWGGKYPYDQDNKVPPKMAEILQVKLKSIHMVLEGGSIETNGQGVLLTTEGCLLNKNRNPKLTKSQIEEKLTRYFNCPKIYWLNKGIKGDDTDGHIDNLCRFVNATTLVYCLTEDRADENYEPLQENLEKIKTFTDREGKPFTIVALPMPDPRYNKTERLPANYANFYIANNLVIVPQFKCPQDQIAVEILQKLFPDRKVLGLDSTDIIIGRGSFHCLTQQIPASQGPLDN